MDFKTINKYTDLAAKILKSDVKPEPLMNVAIHLECQLNKPNQVWFAIYFSKTREVIDSGHFETKDFGQFACFSKQHSTRFNRVPKVKDSGLQLTGSGEVIEKLNKSLMS
jgi:hypothetical protein